MTPMTTHRSLTEAAPTLPELLPFPSSAKIVDGRSFESIPNGVGDDKSFLSIMFDIVEL